MRTVTNPIWPSAVVSVDPIRARLVAAHLLCLPPMAPPSTLVFVDLAILPLELAAHVRGVGLPRVAVRKCYQQLIVGTYSI